MRKGEGDWTRGESPKTLVLDPRIIPLLSGGGIFFAQNFVSRGEHLFLGRVVPFSRISVDDIDKVGYNTCRLSRKTIQR